MKHYHFKDDLTDTDICYLAVKAGQTYTFAFEKVDTLFIYQDIEYKIYQGVKFYFNQCSVKLDNKLVESTKAIIWFRPTDKDPQLSNGYYHCYTADQVTVEVVDTLDEQANFGILNVWSHDMIKCYESTEDSWIKLLQEKDKQAYQAKHGSIRLNRPTMYFSIVLNQKGSSEGINRV